MEKKSLSLCCNGLTALRLEVDDQQPSRLFTANFNATIAAVARDDITLTLSWHDNTALNVRNGYSTLLTAFLFLTERTPAWDQGQLDSNANLPQI